MPCCFPYKAFWTGSYTENGKKDYCLELSTSGDLLNVKRAARKGHHVTPAADLVRIDGQTFIQHPIGVPCGTCVGCRMDKAKVWKVRCCLESLAYKPEEVHFLTLTYDDLHLPHTRYGEPCLSRLDLKQFFKNLRCPEFDVKRKLRYYACGEYGENTKRPHYHVILWMPLDDLVPFSWKKFTSRTIRDAWPFGQILVEEATPGSIAYVCGYVEKKQLDLMERYPVQPFTAMSDKPPLGSNYLPAFKGGKDRKVYGQFGKSNFAAIPRSLLRKCEESVWFADYKARSEELARDMLRANLLAAGTRDQEVLGGVIEDSRYKMLEDLRKETL